MVVCHSDQARDLLTLLQITVSEHLEVEVVYNYIAKKKEVLIRNFTFKNFVGSDLFTIRDEYQNDPELRDISVQHTQ